MASKRTKIRNLKFHLAVGKLIINLLGKYLTIFCHSNYYKFKQDLKSYLTGRCKEKDIDEAEILIDSYAHDILNLLCGKYSIFFKKLSKLNFIFFDRRLHRTF